MRVSFSSASCMQERSNSAMAMRSSFAEAFSGVLASFSPLCCSLLAALAGEATLPSSGLTTGTSELFALEHPSARFV